MCILLFHLLFLTGRLKYKESTLYATHGSSDKVESNGKHMRKPDIEAQKDRGWGQEVKEKQVARPVGREGDETRDLRDERYRDRRAESWNMRYMRSHETERELQTRNARNIVQGVDQT